MPQLDRFLSVMVSNRADAIMLAENDVATLHKGGVARPITKDPLNGPQLLRLLAEIAPPDAAKLLNAGTPTSFQYSSADGVFLTRVTQDAGKWKASIAIDANGEFERATGAYAAGDAVAVAPTATASQRAVTGSQPAVTGSQRAVASTGSQPVVRDVGPSAARRDAGRVEMDRLLRLLVERGGSDLHLRVGEPPVLRTSGEMVRVDGRTPLENEELEIMLHSIMPDRNKKEWAETNDTDYAYEIEGIARFRANALRDRRGAAAVFRVIPATVVNVEQMQITPEVQQLCYLTKGLVLVTGPTGSGKSTTLCALVDMVNRVRNDHVITIEDPIEFVHPNKNCIITQRQVGVHTGSFKSALRAALREDPDIILVGELRDLETVAIAIETAETGHLVFGTLHTTTASGTIDRIIDQFPADRQDQIRVMLAESIKGVVSQTLCRKIGGGRVAAREILLSTPAVSSLIREGKTFQIPSVMQTSKRLGMVTLNDALIELVDGGKVEPKEAFMKCVDKINFATMLRTRGHDTSFLDGETAAAANGKPEPGGAKPGAAPKAVAGAKR